MLQDDSLAPSRFPVLPALQCLSYSGFVVVCQLQCVSCSVLQFNSVTTSLPESQGICYLNMYVRLCVYVCLCVCACHDVLYACLYACSHAF